MGAASFRDYLRGKFSSLGSCCRWKGRWLRVEERVGGNREKERDGGGEGTPAIRALNGSILWSLGPAKF